MDDAVPPKKTIMQRLFPLRPWYRNLWFDSPQTALLVIFVLLASFSYSHDVAQYREVYANPCEYCASAQACGAPGVQAWNYTPGTVWPLNDSGFTVNMTP